jgi:O-antigen/teichoic acid export membrane protein
MADKRSVRGWLLERRNTSRLAYILHLGARLAASSLGLVWTRLLYSAMGVPVAITYLAFQKVVSLGGLGDLGLGGAVAIRTGQALGQGREEELQRFLASARAIFLLLALVAGGGFLLLSPWLPHLLRFKPVPEAGSLVLLFAEGGFLICGVMFASYINNLNYGCGNVTWPVIPSLLVLQLSMLGHWLLARQHYPLWVQYTPYMGATIVNLILTWFYVRVSHPKLAILGALSFDLRMARGLVESSFWVYLCSLGNSVYRNTDGLVINAGSQSGRLLEYECNYRFCELTVFMALTASLVTLPKITQWMASPDPKDQERVRLEMQRLNQFQTLLGCGAALAYLAGNDWFMKIWWWHKENIVPAAPLLWQVAFALNMTVTICGDAGIQLSLRSGTRGLRAIGSVIGLTALLNLGLSILAMKLGSIAGIAFATVLAQTVLSVSASIYICRQLQLPLRTWIFRSWLLPVAGVGFAAWLRMKLPADSFPHVALLAGCYTAMLAAAAWGLGIRLSFIREELRILKSFIGK